MIMILKQIIHKINVKKLLPFLGIFLITGFYLPAYTQEKPPVPISVTVFLNSGLNLGGFSVGNSGGTVIVYQDGTRSAAGEVTLINLGFLVSPVIFEIEANPGTIISLLYGPDAVLTGSNGGSMSLHIGGSDPASPFITAVAPPGLTQVRVGGTLSVGNPIANPPGAYSGSFMITFIQE